MGASTYVILKRKYTDASAAPATGYMAGSNADEKLFLIANIKAPMDVETAMARHHITIKLPFSWREFMFSSKSVLATCVIVALTPRMSSERCSHGCEHTARLLNPMVRHSFLFGALFCRVETYKVIKFGQQSFLGQWLSIFV